MSGKERRDLTQTEKAWADNLKDAQKKARKRDSKYTQEYIANQLGITQATLSHYISGRNPINRGILFEVCLVLEVSPMSVAPELVPDSMFGGKSNMDKLLNVFSKLDPDMQDSYLKLMESSLKD